MGNGSKRLSGCDEAVKPDGKQKAEGRKRKVECFSAYCLLLAFHHAKKTSSVKVVVTRAESKQN